MSSWVRSGSTRTVSLAPRNRVITSCSGNLVTCKLKGGLGNRLFQIFAGLAYAERTGRQFVFCEHLIGSNSHTGLQETMSMLCAFFPQVKFFKGVGHIWTTWSEPDGRLFDGDAIPDLTGSVILQGFFQNGKFSENLRGQFRIPKPQNSVFAISEINFAETYFLHYRFGDYVGTPYDVLSEKYYAGAIENLRSKFAGCKFLIFSDQPEKVSIMEGFTIVPKTVNTWESLYLMSLCSGGICANSTFSWFGAFYCEGNSEKILMPEVWIKGVPGGPVSKWATMLTVS